MLMLNKTVGSWFAYHHYYFSEFTIKLEQQTVYL